MIIARFYVSALIAGNGGRHSVDLNAVCRDRANKDWAAATPSGQLKVASLDAPDFDWILASLRDPDSSPEFSVYLGRSRDEVAARSRIVRAVELLGVTRDQWNRDAATAVVLKSLHGEPWAEISMTIANTGAAAELLSAFAHGDTDWHVGIAPGTE